jgi:hypothetical protein
VLDVAFRELPGRRPQDLVAGDVRARHHQRQDVLQLVPEAVGAPGLVEGGPGPHATRERLVEKPAIEEQIHGGIRRLDVHGPQHRIPPFLDLLQQRIRVFRSVALHERSRCVPAPTLAQEEDDFSLLPGLQLDLGLERRAGVQRGPGLPRQRIAALE